MKLSKVTVQPLLAAWSAERRPAWSSHEVEDITRSLLELSEAVVPHWVADRDLSDAEIQRFVLRRTLSTIDDQLTRVAHGVRSSLGGCAERRTPDGHFPIGLRSATQKELEDLPGIGARRAKELARVLALHPNVDSLAALDMVEGIGPQTLARLEGIAYLDEPIMTLVSNPLVSFSRNPSLQSFLALLDESGLEVVFGDATTLARRPLHAGAPAARFLRFIELCRQWAERRISPAAGAIASEAAAFLARHDLREQRLEALRPASGGLLVSGSYVQAVAERIGKATDEIRMMMFLATASADAPHALGSLAVVEALEARAAAGVKVRVILDRDEPAAPYKSEVINRPLVKRFVAAGIGVKMDAPSTLLHSKFFVIDEAAVVVGSHNLTRAAMTEAHEVSVLLECPELAATFSGRFDTLWESLPALA